MEKQVLTKRDIQKELLAKLNKRKGIAVFLTVIVTVGIVLYPIHLMKYFSGRPLDYTGGLKTLDVTPTVAMFVMPLLIIFLVICVFYLYYMDFYKIKKGKFEIIEDTLRHKCKEWRRYYKNTQRENSLYFHSGRAAVEDEVYAYSKTRDKFYVIILKSKKKSKNETLLAYHTEYYEINFD